MIESELTGCPEMSFLINRSGLHDLNQSRVHRNLGIASLAVVIGTPETVHPETPP
jgi:hypothetical protein